MTTSPGNPRRSVRTTVLTSLSILAIALTGAVAIGANLGILDAADANSVGKLSAAGDLAPSRRVIDVYPDQPAAASTLAATGAPTTAGAAATSAPVPAPSGAPPATTAVQTVQTTPASAPIPAPPPTTAPSNAERFTVDVAGSVTVSRIDGGLHLDRVAPAAGWTWVRTRSGPGALGVTLTNHARSLVFRATLAADGTIAATVDEPSSSPISTNPPTATHGGSDHGGAEDD